MLLFEYICSVDPIVEELLPDKTIHGMCRISLLRDAARKAAKTATGRRVRKAMRNQHLTSNSLGDVSISFNMSEVIHFAVEEPLHHGIDLTKDFLGVFGAFHRIDKNLDLLLPVFSQDDFDNGIGIHDCRGLRSADNNDFLRGKEKMNYIARNPRRGIEDRKSVV